MARKKVANTTEMKKAKASAMKHLKSAQKKFAKTQTRVKQYIKTHPGQAAVLAASLGAAIGAIATAKIMKRK